VSVRVNVGVRVLVLAGAAVYVCDGVQVRVGVCVGVCVRVKVAVFAAVGVRVGVLTTPSKAISRIL
jgi:hypothetical protein